MITELRRMPVVDSAGKKVWIIPDLWLACLRVELAVGEPYEVYNPDGHPFVSSGFADGDIGPLRSATVIAPGGRIKVHNALLEGPTIWEGSLNPVCNGVFIKARVEFEAEVPSLLLCASPAPDLTRFEGKILERLIIRAGESYTFAPGAVGFAVVYGPDEMRGFGVLPGDTLAPDEDMVIALVSEGGA